MFVMTLAHVREKGRVVTKQEFVCVARATTKAIWRKISPAFDLQGFMKRQLYQLI
jgi:hypothetical protein